MTTHSSIYPEGDGTPSSTSSAIFENDQINDQIDRSPLLGDSIDVEVESTYEERIGIASRFSCMINLANTILGTGMLAMPAAVASVGLLLGSMMIIFAATTSGLGLYFLSRSATHTDGRNSSFFAISKLTYPSAALLFDAAIAIKCFGVAVSYLIIVGDLMPQVINGSLGFSNEYSIFMDRRFWITAFMFIIIPLAFLKKLDSLRHTSFIAIVAVIYLVFIVIYHYFGPDYKAPPKEKIHLIKISTKFFTNLPIFIFAFTCHQNIFSIYNELVDNSQTNINNVVTGAIGTTTTIYQIIGLLGYLSFGDDVLPNVISMYETNVFVTIGRIAFVICILFSYPLQAHPARACLDKIFSFKSNSTNGYIKLSSPETLNIKFIILTSGILISSYTIAILVSKLDLVLAFVGSTGSTIISFILPGLFYYKIHENDPWDRKKILAACLTFYGLCVMTICLTLNIVKVYSAK
ncbi:vacuolar amino acid transporter 5 [Glomus cerebriforme]|uniref:Vacuolar amino acid transporter 5 n=1 Tax=Glomus cerebriforme TaxID=658196 RepID=A0A397TLZ6_9GLOM|nr:vacuolar amino acid transporter 5 [Glomus cerebriforme]